MILSARHRSEGAGKPLQRIIKKLSQLKLLVTCISREVKKLPIPIRRNSIGALLITSILPGLDLITIDIQPYLVESVFSF